MIIAICVAIILSLLIKNSNKKSNTLIYSIERKVNLNPIVTKIVNFDKKYSVMKLVENNLFFVSWKEESDKRKIFKYSLQNYSFDKEINLSTKKDSILIDNYFIKKDSIIIFNKIKKSIIILNKDLIKISEKKYPKQFSRATNFGKNILISGWNDKFEIYFEKLDLKNNSIAKVVFDDKYSTEYENTGITLDGFYYDNNNYYVNLPYSINRAFIFNNKFENISKLDLIYNKLDYAYRKSSKGDVFPDPNNLNPNLSGFLDKKNYFYILTDTSTKFDNFNKCYIDIYNLLENKYIKSIQIKDYLGSKPRHFVYRNNEFIVLYDKNLIFYKI